MLQACQCCTDIEQGRKFTDDIFPLAKEKILVGDNIRFTIFQQEYLSLVYSSRRVYIDIIKGMVFTLDRKSTRLNSSHVKISYAVFCLKKKKITFYLQLKK